MVDSSESQPSSQEQQITDLAEDLYPRVICRAEDEFNNLRRGSPNANYRQLSQFANIAGSRSLATFDAMVEEVREILSGKIRNKLFSKVSKPNRLENSEGARLSEELHSYKVSLKSLPNCNTDRRIAPYSSFN